MPSHIYKAKSNFYFLRFSLLGHRVHESTRTKDLKEAKRLLLQRKIEIVQEEMRISRAPIKELHQGLDGVYWLRFVLNNEVIYETTNTRDILKASEILNNRKHNIVKRVPPDALPMIKDMLLKDAIIKAQKTYIPDLRGGKDVVLRLNKIADWLGDSIPLSSINKTHFMRIREHLRAKGVSATTINHYSSNLNTLLRTANMEWGLNCVRVKGVKLAVKKAHIRVITQEEDAFIRRWMSSPEALKGIRCKWDGKTLLEIYDLLLLTGMRRGELFTFRVSQIDDNKIVLRPSQHKTGDSYGNKAIALSDRAQHILRERIKRLNLVPNDIVFPYKGQQYARLWKKMRDDMDIPEDNRFTPHCTRHTFASNLAKKGVPLVIVSKLLGHTSITTTEMYAHFFIDHYIEAVNLLNK